MLDYILDQDKIAKKKKKKNTPGMIWQNVNKDYCVDNST